MLYSNKGGVLLKIVESLLFVRAGAGVGGAAGEKNPPASQHCTCTMYRYCALCNVQCAMCNVHTCGLAGGWPHGLQPNLYRIERMADSQG